MRRVFTVLAFLVAMSGMVVARPRPGANHHAGDDSFVDAFGRVPDARDGEELRMHTHLAWIRARLGAAQATESGLAARRAELLGYLDDYIAKGVTPKNTYVPWRSPVFIDREGNVCAVGYLIERSVGRDLAEHIAAAHRTNFLEDIAVAEPSVRAWIASSGFTLDELATIQPAYAEPEAITWRSWNLVEHVPLDGLYKHDVIAGTGVFTKGRMEGTWSVLDKEHNVVGIGVMKRGRGTWTSLYADGTKHAEGRYADNRAEGRWRIYHASGNLAAEGRFEGGARVGRWTIYYDTNAKTPIARGSFDANGEVTGHWTHFDPEGSVVARTWTETPAQFADHDINVSGGEGFVLDVVRGDDNVVQRRHLGMPKAVGVKLTMLERDGERLYIHAIEDVERIYDQDGFLLETDLADKWHAKRCHWSEKRKAIARAGDVARMNGLLFQDLVRHAGKFAEFDYPAPEKIETLGAACDEKRTLDDTRSLAIEALLASREHVRSPAPAFAVRKQWDSDADAYTDDEDAKKADLVDELANDMQMYQQWAHVDGVFTAAFETMPGRFQRYWHSGDPEEGQ